MANMNIVGQSPNDLSGEEHYPSLNQPHYQATHHFRVFEPPNLDRLGIMPDTQTPSTYPLTAMESIGCDIRAETEMPCLLLPDWNEPHAPFEHGWGDDWTVYNDFNLNSIHSDDYSTTDGFSLLSNPETDGLFGEAISQPTSQETLCNIAATPASWARPIPVSSSTPAMVDQSGSSYALDGILTRPPSTAPSSSNTIYTCEACDKKYPKMSVLTRHKKSHVRPIHCPVKSCKHRTAERRDMNRHVDVYHTGHMPAQKVSSAPRLGCPVALCEYAQRGFTRQDNLRRHLLQKHPGQLP